VVWISSALGLEESYPAEVWLGNMMVSYLLTGLLLVTTRRLRMQKRPEAENVWSVRLDTWRLPDDMTIFTAPNGLELHVLNKDMIGVLVALAKPAGSQLLFPNCDTRLEITDSAWLKVVDTDPWVNPGFTSGDYVCSVESLARMVGPVAHAFFVARPN
jgi:hypothetical protein